MMRLKKERNGKERIVEGKTIEDFEVYFGYTLLLAFEAGKIKKKGGFRTLKQFVTTLEKAFDYVEGCCYERTSITII